MGHAQNSRQTTGNVSTSPNPAGNSNGVVNYTTPPLQDTSRISRQPTLQPQPPSGSRSDEMNLKNNLKSADEMQKGVDITKEKDTRVYPETRDTLKTILQTDSLPK